MNWLKWLLGQRSGEPTPRPGTTTDPGDTPSWDLLVKRRGHPVSTLTISLDACDLSPGLPDAAWSLGSPSSDAAIRLPETTLDSARLRVCPGGHHLYLIGTRPDAESPSIRFLANLEDLDSGAPEPAELRSFREGTGESNEAVELRFDERAIRIGADVAIQLVRRSGR